MVWGKCVYVLELNVFVVLAVGGYCSLCLNLWGEASPKIRAWVSFVASHGHGYFWG
jgi:hypothetical protein